MKQTEDGHAAINGLSQLSKERSEGDPRLARAMEEYQALLAAGGKPDHGEFLARYPEVAGALADCLAGLDFLHVAAPDLSAPVVDGTPAEGLEAGAPLGDFRLIREVGRGGMGVVYEAEQISMGRRVALKVLPFAAVMDPRQLQRFKNEARGAGSLQHPNIVPVYFVGSERGVHYFAMQFIEGQTLAALLQELRQPATPERVADPVAATETAARQSTLAASASVKGQEYYRRVVEWAEKAAEALDHAHQTGIVHRDVKPGNLMLDARGNLWVTDFGLAHVQQGEANLTMTGDLVGTLRYMSPEQALGKRVVIDHRTDVYSLGATLYELLTLRPAVEGADRQEVLRRIAFDEPVAPRKIDRGIPAELETIVLKAMEKNPQDRYATAQELADDLRHWLEDRPIRARRPSLARRTARWSRRHKPLVGATLAVLLMAAVLGGGTWLWWAQKRAEAQGEARAALVEAAGLQQEERWTEALGVVRRARSALAGMWANPGLVQLVHEREKDLEMAQRLDEACLLMAAAKGEYFDVEATSSALADAFEWYGLGVEGLVLDPREAAAFIRSRSIRLQLALALDHWASLRKGLGAGGWSQMLAVSRAADPDPWRDELRDSLEGKVGSDLKKLTVSASGDELPPVTAVLLARLSRGTAAFEGALGVLRQVQRRHPNDFWVNAQLGVGLHELGAARMEEAIGFYRAALASRPLSPSAHRNLGITLAVIGRLDEAIAEFTEAIRLKKDYVAAHHSLGNALTDQRRLDEAIACYRKALALDPKYADAHHNLGTALYHKRQLDEAIACWRQALALNPKDARAHGNLGSALRDKGQLNEAIACCRKAIALDPKYPGGYLNLGTALKGKGQVDEAIACYKKALALDPKLAVAHYNLGNALKGKGQLDEAITCYHKAIALDPKFALSHNNLGNALQDIGRLDEAISCFRQALKLNPKYAFAHGNLGNALSRKNQVDEAITCFRQALALNPQFADAHTGLGSALKAKGQLDEAIACYRQALEFNPKNATALNNLKKAERLAAARDKLSALQDGRYTPATTGERLALAEWCHVKKLHRTTVGLYAAAFATDLKLGDDLKAGHRYAAACSAALAAGGQGEDLAKLDEKECAHLRQQALDWLRADLDAWNKLLKKEPDKIRYVVMRAMHHWLQATDLAGVRAPQSLAKLPESERLAWQKLWVDVADLLARTKESPLKSKEKPSKP